MNLIYSLIFAASLIAQPVTVAAQSGVATQSTQLTVVPKSTTTFGLVDSAANATGAVSINLTASTTRPQVQPTALSFTINWVAADTSSVIITLGPAFAPAGKTLTCVSAVASTVCSISGGGSTLPNGVVAIVSATVNKATTFSLTALAATNKFGLQLLTALTPGGAVSLSVQLASITCAAPQIEPGEDVACTATLTQVAPAAGTTVQLNSSSPSAVGLVSVAGVVISSVLIPAGSTTGNFIARGL